MDPAAKLFIERIGPDHLDQLQQVARQTFDETFRDTNTRENLDKYLERSFNTPKLLKELNHPCSWFYLASINRDVVGYLKVNTCDAQTEQQPEGAFEIERIYVVKAWWGKAVGQALLDLSLKIAAEMKSTYVWLGVWEKNHRAIRFYQKNGFEVFDTHVFRIGDETQTDYLMKRVMLGHDSPRGNETKA